MRVSLSTMASPRSRWMRARIRVASGVVRKGRRVMRLGIVALSGKSIMAT